MLVLPFMPPAMYGALGALANDVWRNLPRTAAEATRLADKLNAEGAKARGRGSVRSARPTNSSAPRRAHVANPVSPRAVYARRNAARAS